MGEPKLRDGRYYYVTMGRRDGETFCMVVPRARWERRWWRLRRWIGGAS